MGSFLGHVQGGVPLLLFGIRWLYCLLMRYFLCRKARTLGNIKIPKFLSSTNYPSSCRPGLPIESIILIVAMAVDITMEIGGSVLGMYSFVMNGQHIIMKVFFLLFAIVCVLRHYRRLPFEGIEYPLILIPFLVSALVLYVHTGGKPVIEIHTHVYSSLTDLVVVLMLALEMTYRNNVLVGIFRCIAVTTVGSWLVVIAVTQYDTVGMQMDQKDPMNIKVVLLLYLWNFFGNILLAFQIGCVVFMRIRLMSPPQVYEALNISYGKDLQKSAYDPEQGKHLLPDSDDEVY